MLVASTYSLYPANQWIITPHEAQSHVLFSNQGAQGLYNAVTAHLWEMGISAYRHGPQLLEFSTPYETAHRDFHPPPVWIGAVGERGLYPLRNLPVREDSGYLYDPRETPERRPFSLLDDREQSESVSSNPMRPSPHILYWLIWLTLVTTCFVAAGLTWSYAQWAADESKSRIGPTSFRRLLRYLNVEVARRRPGEGFHPRMRTRSGSTG